MNRFISLILITIILSATVLSLFAYQASAQESQLAPEYDSPYVEQYISSENMERVDLIIEKVSSPSATYSVLTIFLILFLMMCYFGLIALLVMVFIGHM